MELKIPTREDFRAFYNCVLTEAFPEEELKPLKAMEALWDMGRYEKYISIPWDESMGIPALEPWEEEI